MPDPHDLAFAKAAQAQKALTQQQFATLVQAQKLFASLKISKAYATVAVEANLMPEGRAAQIVGSIKGHPPLTATRSSLPLEAAAQKAVDEGHIDADTLEHIEALHSALEGIGIHRGLGEIAADLGLVKPEPADPSTGSGQGPRKGTSVRMRGTTSMKAGTGAKTKPVVASAAKKGNGALVGGIAAAVILVLAIGGYFAMGSTKQPSTHVSRTPEKPVTTQAPAPVTTPAPPPKPELTFEQELAAKKEKGAEDLWKGAQSLAVEQKWKEAWGKIEDLKRAFTATEFFKSNSAAISILASDVEKKLPRSEDDPPTPANRTPTADPPANTEALKADYEKQRSERLATGRQRVDEARKALDAERAAEKTRLAELLKRLTGQKLQLALRQGLRLDNAMITQLAKDTVRLSFESEGAQAEMDIPWEALADKSYIELQKAIYSQDGAAGWYEVGRQCITRKMWKDAKAAFDECRKKDATFVDRIPDLDPVLKNEGAFKGSSKRLGRDGLVLTYDWSEADQRADFKPAQDWKVGGGTAVITPRGQSLSSLKEVDFEGELAVDAQVNIADGASFIIGCFYDGLRRTGYFLHLGSKGASLYRWDGNQPAAASAHKDGKIAGDCAIRFAVRGGSWKVTSNGTEVFSGSDAAHAKGWMYIGAVGGAVTLKKMTVTGKANPTELDKTFAETEVLIRRALEGDLRPRKAGQRENRDFTLHIEHEYFLSQLDAQDRATFDKVKEKIVTAANQGVWRDARDVVGPNNVVVSLDALVKKYPDVRAIVFWRGRAYAMTGRAEQARKDYEVAAKDPDCPEALTQLAEVAMGERDFKKAKALVEEALKSTPDDASAIALRSLTTFSTTVDHKELLKGNVPATLKAALADFDVAMKLAPDDQEVRERRRAVANVIKGPRHLGCKFLVETPHYLVMTDISQEKTKQYGERLEAAYAYYRETFKEFFKEDASRLKPRIAIFNTREAYLTYGELTLGRRQENTLGYFIPMYTELLLFEDVDLGDTLQTMYHEAFHQFMSLMIPNAPFWYNEGIAEYMGSITVEKGKVVAKARVLNRLLGLKPNLRAALPFDNIMNQSPGEFYAGPVSFKYAQAWSMVHFCYEHEGGKYRRLIDAYYKALLEGKSMREAYQEVFAKEDLKALKTEWEAYVGKMEMPK